MKLNNSFSQKTRLLFLYEYNCMNCGRSDHGLELHHLYGRVSNSPLNACLLCPVCHHAGKRDEQFKNEMKPKILNLLEREEYCLDEEDNKFYVKHYA